MKYLLDTHVILWWLTTPEKIKPKAQKIIKDKSNEIYISSASFWEIAIKQSIGRLRLPHNLIEACQMESFKTLAITPEDGLSVADLPLIHTDPFDRLLIMQAKLHDMVFITSDSQIAKYPVVLLQA